MAPPATASSMPFTPAAAVGAAAPGAAVVETVVLVCGLLLPLPLPPLVELLVLLPLPLPPPVPLAVGVGDAPPPLAVAAVALPVMAPGPHDEPVGVKYRLTAGSLGLASLLVVAPVLGLGAA